MNKALHVFVYLFLVLAGAALWFEVELNNKRQLLTDRNRMQENYLIKIAGTIEKADAEKGALAVLNKDASPVEAKAVDNPDYENVLEDYNRHYEAANLETFNWNNQASREQLRKVYVYDIEGNVVMNGNQPQMEGPGTEDELLSTLLDAAKAQQTRLNNTRAELEKLRGKLESAIDEINSMKGLSREDKLMIEEKKSEIARLEQEKAALEDTVTRLKVRIEELNAEVANLNDAVLTARNEAEELREELAKREKLVEQLKKLLADNINRGSSTAAGTAVTSLPIGDKGKIVRVDNEHMFVIVEFTEEAMKQLKGNNPDAVLPALALGVKRTGFDGPAGEFLGRVKIRQEVKGKPYVICDILDSWKQADFAINDVVFAD